MTTDAGSLIDNRPKESMDISTLTAGTDRLNTTQNDPVGRSSFAAYQSCRIGFLHFAISVPWLALTSNAMAGPDVERGVRFVQTWHGDMQPWDSHSIIGEEHRKRANECDSGLAALIIDLKQRGLLDETLILCTGEFGRTPSVEMGQDGSGASQGRDHNHWGFSLWMAGGGIKKGTVYGATDDFGFKAVENPVSAHDLHATILHLMGYEHQRMTYRYAGRDFRLTDVKGEVIQPIIES